MSSLAAAQEHFLDVIDRFFMAMDTNGDGLVNIDELVAAMQSHTRLREFMQVDSEAEMRQIFADIDTLKHDRITKEEFLAYFFDKNDIRHSEIGRVISSLFTVLDPDMTSSVCPKSLARSLQRNHPVQDLVLRRPSAKSAVALIIEELESRTEPLSEEQFFTYLQESRFQHLQQDMIDYVTKYRAGHVRIGDVAPDFDAESSQGDFNLYRWIEGKWAVIFSHPRDFTDVCATELGRAAQLKDEWSSRHTVVAGLSVDTLDNHMKWLDDIKDICGVEVNFPIIADPDRKVSLLYGMLDHQSKQLGEAGLVTVRSVFIIDPDKKVRLIITYPASTGRSFVEILRVLDSLQMADAHQVGTPADWNLGDDVVVLPEVSTSDARARFPRGVKEVKPWLRVTPDPR